MPIPTLIRCAFRRNDAEKIDARAHCVDAAAGGEPDRLDGLPGPQRELLRRIRAAAGGTQAEFDRLYLPVLKNYARHLQRLSADGTCRKTDAMLCLGIQVAFYALQASGGVMFSGRESAERRRILEPRWRYATFIAGLCVEACRPLGESGTAAAMAKILPADCAQYLREGGNHVFPAMLDAIAGASGQGEYFALRRIVDDVRSRVLGQDEDAALAPCLIDAMRRLFRNGTWKVGERKARLWYAVDGLYLVWKTAANEIGDLFDRERIQGPPRDADALRDILARAGVIEPNGRGGFLWNIRPPNAANSLIAVKINDPQLLFGDATPQALPHAIGQAWEPEPRAEDR